MSIVVDYTSRIDPAALKAAGVVGVCRYLAPASTAWKVIGKVEYTELIRAGIKVYLNWEFDAEDWKMGKTVGAHHGVEAVRQAKALGYPPGSVIIGSADFDMTIHDWTTNGSGYALGFSASIRAGGFRPGVYGPWDVLEWVRNAGIMDAFWQAGMSTAWSHGRNAHAWPYANYRQKGKLTIGGTSVDYSDILNPNWEPHTMKQATIYRRSNGACILRDGAFYHPIPDVAELASIQRLIGLAGGDGGLKPVSDADWPTLVATGIPMSFATDPPAWSQAITLTQDQINTGIAANVPAIAAALAEHFKIS